LSNLSQKPAGFRSFVVTEGVFIMATFATSGVGYLGSTAAPFILEALYKSGLSYERAGNLGTIELLTLAVVATLIGPFVTRISHKKLAITGALLAAVGVATSAMSGIDNYTLMIIGRVITGVGSGLAISAANAAVAAREDAERIFAIIWTMGGGITATLPLIIPRVANLEIGMDPVIEGGNYRAGFVLLFVGCFALLAFMFKLPARPASLETAPPPQVGSDASLENGSEGQLGASEKLLATLALSGMFIYSVGEMALWQFAYTIPVQAGLDEDLVAYVISTTTLIGLAAGAVAAWLGTRMGRVFPIVLGTCISLLGRFLFLSATSIEVLWIGGLCWGAGFYFVSPFQIGLVSALDRRGRLAVASGAAMNYGYALGPGIAGSTLDNLDKSALIWIICTATVVSLALLLPLAFRVNKTSD
jgi:MFS family permease